MSKTLIDALQEDDAKAMLVVGAAVALHGVLAGGLSPSPETIKQAFDLSEEFWAEATRRCLKP